MQALKVKADEIYSHVDKKADEVRVLKLSVNELTQALTETKNDIDKSIKNVKNGQTEVLLI